MNGSYGSRMEKEFRKMASLTLQIEGMSCGHCLNAVNKALTELDGVTIKEVRMGRAEVEYDPAKVDQGKIVGAVSEAGYQATAA